MNIGITTVNDENYHPNLRLKQTAADKGHSLFLINPHLCISEILNIKLSVNQAQNPPESRSGMPLPHVVIPRQGSEITPFSLTVTNHFKNMGIPLVNDIESIILASNQFLTLQHLAGRGIAVPDTLFINSPDKFPDAVDRLGGYPVIAKRTDGRQGQGVLLIHSEKEAQRLVPSCINDSKGLMVQRFIPMDGRKDIRVLVVGGKIAAAMELITGHGDFRANYHLHQKAVKTVLSQEMEEKAVKAAGCMGLEIAGVDLIADKDLGVMVLEVNYSPGFKGLEKTTGLDVAGMIIDHALACA